MAHHDFFTQAQSATSVALPALTPVVPPLEDFARAIGSRIAPALVANPLPACPTRPMAALTLSSSPPRAGGPSSQPTSAPGTSEFRAVGPTELAVVLGRSSTLVLDLRPNASYSLARLPNALSLSVPSTLLKRPAFSLQKLSTMMRSTSRDRFLKWPDAATILVYDSDTSTLVEGNNILGLLRKFKAAGFSGEIAWLRGGFTAVWKSAQHLITQVPLPDESESGEDDNPSPSTSTGFLRAQNLSMAAFQQSTTTRTARTGPAAPLSSASPPGGLASAYAPSMDAAAPPASTRVTAANFFFDNIRQNVELAQGITQRIPLKLPPDVIARAQHQLPFKWLRDILARSEEEEADILAMQFYKIELGEQRRMQGVMDHHTKNAFSTDQTKFPYSISASIEKGTKNRYRDIYPFEHNRVKLRHGQTSEDGSDYMNASFIQPLGTDRRYIATQGPLPTTFTDFWTLCWEQNVSVIVMLTRQVEGAHLKCGSYWTDNRFGSLRLDPISVEGPTEEAERNVQAGGFDLGGVKEETTHKFDPATSVIQRKFWLSHDDDSSSKPRHITQLQYLGWPDVNVPSDADGLLWLINAVDKAVEEARATATAAGSTIPPGPVLLHCSAGVGRTGGFIVVDAVLDALRRELRESAATTMYIDPSPSPSSSPPPPSRVRKGQAITPPSSSESSGTSSAGRAIAGISSRNFLASRSILRSGAPRSLLTTSRSGGDESSTNGYSSNPHLFDSSGTGNSSASSVEADSCDDVPMSEQSDDGLRPSRGHSSSSEDVLDPDGDPMCTPCVPVASAGSTYFDTTRPSSSAPTAHNDQAAAVELHSTSAFDYAPPRDLRSSSPPIRLDTLSEPIRDVLEDLRKQRMSLCQSLRQYVFVHRAIVEGALAIVEEEQKAGRYPRSPSLTKVTLPEDSLAKRGSLKRKQRTPDDEDVTQGRIHRSGAVRR